MKEYILIADDSMAARGYTRSMLEPEGYNIGEAENGLVALEKIKDSKPDLLLLDLLMPELDGFDVLEKLQKEGASFPIIVLTADIQEEVREECLELGAKALLNKPIDFVELKSLIGKLLNH